MNINKITLENYNTLVEWYLNWNLPVTPYSYIPSSSFMVESICAGFLYQLGNTPMFWVEGVITNPKIKNKILKKEALSLLISTLEKEANSLGCELLLTSTPRTGLNSIFNDCGFKNTPENYFHLAKRIK